MIVKVHSLSLRCCSFPLAILLTLLWFHSGEANEDVAIIPYPKELKVDDGMFLLEGGVTIGSTADLEPLAHMLASAIHRSTGITIPVVIGRRCFESLPNTRLIRLESTTDLDCEAEGYTLEVSSKSVIIRGKDPAGAFYGAQSLLQLISAERYSHLPCCVIKDEPRFRWRGVMLDVGRYFFEVQDIKQLIDWLAVHKLNILHLHLTEDQGWRIEIKRYPRLTSVGAWRESSPIAGNRDVGDGQRYGGFYTQEDIRELVAYAQSRHVTIVPEIDMPGHMSAAIASYPELGNDDIPGFNPAVASRWGVQYYTLSPKEQTFEWITGVLDEVCDLFPSPYIHIGGDEARKEQWKESAFAQSVIKREGLANEKELQSWFVRRIENILKKKRRRLIGWDEIREGGLSPGATVMAWRTWKAAERSAREGHDVILSPKSHTYFDYYQFVPEVELAKGLDYEAIGGYLPLWKVYDFDPMPPSLLGTEYEAKVLGGQAQIWTEYMRNWKKVEYMTFPRISAFAEACWTSPQDKNYASFLRRLRPILGKLEAARVRYADPFQIHANSCKDGASVNTTLPAFGSSAPELAYDGDWQTYFWSARAPQTGDVFELKFESPISNQPVKIYTGTANLGTRVRAWGGRLDSLREGVLEATRNGHHWKRVATFEDGMVDAMVGDDCSGIRLRSTQNHPPGRLVIREIQIGDGIVE